MREPSQRVQPVEVLHACEDARQISDLVDLQAVGGIRPYLLTNPRSGSRWWWMRAWNEVREWRRLLSGFQISLVHAHTFPSGMAAVRGDAAVVYGLQQFVEDRLLDGSGKWMDRSFRAAEHFVLTQAEAVVVATAAMRHRVIERDTPAEKVFWIPEALEPSFCERSQWLREAFDVPQGTLTVFCTTANTAVLKAVADCLKEHHAMRFFMRTCNQLHSRPMMVPLLAEDDFGAAIRSADIVIAGDEECAVQAMRHGAALALADTLYLRDLAPHGEGCLWFRTGEELASKLCFLAQHEDFRRALADAGRSYMLNERSPGTIAKAYLNAYRYALENRRPPSGPTDFSGSLIPIHAA